MIFRCIICERSSFEIICKECQKRYLSVKIRKKDNIISFYDYDTAEWLIKYKYHKFGHRVFKILAKNTLKIFAKEIKNYFYVIPVDDKIDKGYSHTAILAHFMKTKYLTPLYDTLHATNKVKYAGKSLKFRLNNPRNFIYKGAKNIDVILVDDIVTTSLTIREAENVLKKHDVSVALKVVLCDLRK